MERKTFLTVKQSINFLRSGRSSRANKSYLFVPPKKPRQRYINQWSENFFQLEGTLVYCFILNGISSLFLVEFNKYHFYTEIGLEKQYRTISVHQPLNFIEKHWDSSCFFFYGRVSFFLHPEILVRLLRKEFQDASFFHMLRKFLYCNIDLAEIKIKNLRDFKMILWNFYLLEIDNIFTRLIPSYFLSTEQNFVLPNISCFKKTNEWNYLESSAQDKFFTLKNTYNKFMLSYSEIRMQKEPQFFLFSCFPAYKYVRASGNWYLCFHNTSCKTGLSFLKRWILTLFARRLGYKVEEKPPLNALNNSWSFEKNDCHFFLGYFFQFSEQTDLVRLNTKLFFLTNYVTKRITYFANPFFLTALFLSKQHLFSSLLVPRKKSKLVTWSDWDIMEHYNSVQHGLNLYYSSCDNKRFLFRISYILSFSCIKTLSFKYKGNFYQISKKFGQDLKLEPTFFSSSNLFKQNYLRNFNRKSCSSTKKEIKVWNLNLKQVSPRLLYLEEFSIFY
jgi:hypothetical protein